MYTLSIFYAISKPFYLKGKLIMVKLSVIFCNILR